MFRLNPVPEAAFEGFWQHIKSLTKPSPYMWGGDSILMYAPVEDHAIIPSVGGIEYIGIKTGEGPKFQGDDVGKGLVFGITLSYSAGGSGGYRHAYLYEIGGSQEITQPFPYRPPVGTIFTEVVEYDQKVTGKNWTWSTHSGNKVPLYWGYGMVTTDILETPLEADKVIDTYVVTVPDLPITTSKYKIISHRALNSRNRAVFKPSDFGRDMPKIFWSNSKAYSVTQYIKCTSHDNAKMFMMVGDRRIYILLPVDDTATEIVLEKRERNIRIATKSYPWTSIADSTDDKRRESHRVQIPEENLKSYKVIRRTTAEYRGRWNGWKKISTDWEGGGGVVDLVNSHAASLIKQIGGEMDIQPAGTGFTYAMTDPVTKEDLGVTFTSFAKNPPVGLNDVLSGLSASKMSDGILNSGKVYARGGVTTVSSSYDKNPELSRTFMIPLCLSYNYRDWRGNYSNMYDRVNIPASANLDPTYDQTYPLLSFLMHGRGELEGITKDMVSPSTSTYASRFPEMYSYVSVPLWGDIKGYIQRCRIEKVMHDDFGVVGFDIHGTIGDSPDPTSTTRSYTGLLFELRFTCFHFKKYNIQADPDNGWVYYNYKLDIIENLDVYRGDTFGIERTRDQWDAFYRLPEDGTPDNSYTSSFYVFWGHLKAEVFNIAKTEAEMVYPNIGDSFTSP